MFKFVSLVPKQVIEDSYVIDNIKYIDTLNILTKDIDNKDYRLSTVRTNIRTRENRYEKSLHLQG